MRTGRGSATDHTVRFGQRFIAPASEQRAVAGGEQQAPGGPSQVFGGTKTGGKPDGAHAGTTGFLPGELFVNRAVSLTPIVAMVCFLGLDAFSFDLEASLLTWRSCPGFFT